MNSVNGNFHLKHHAFQGVHELDADLPDWYEAKLINNYFIGKAIWLLFFPIFQGIRTLRCKEVTFMDKFTIMNMVAQISFDIAIDTDKAVYTPGEEVEMQIDQQHNEFEDDQDDNYEMVSGEYSSSSY